MVEWPNDGPLSIKIILFLMSTGLGGWLFRRSPRRLGRWFSKRIHLEKENIDLMSENNSLRHRITRKDDENEQLVRELEEVHRRVEENRRRAERIDSLLGSLDAPPPALPTTIPTSGESSTTPTPT